MIVVTGTKRSGTSMWMQILSAAGFPPIGDAFPRDWGEMPLKEANPAGFYESSFRHGIHGGTNPIPGTDHYVTPEGTERMAVKVFPSGFLRTHRAFIDRVLVCQRSWRAYVQSRARLVELDRASRQQRGQVDLQRRLMPAAIEWWLENVSLLRDLQMRRFDTRWVSYEGVLREPARVDEILTWLGAVRTRDVIDQSLQTQDACAAVEDELPKGMAELCDAWCSAIDESERPESASGLSEGLSRRILVLHQQMRPELERYVTAQHAENARVRQGR